MLTNEQLAAAVESAGITTQEELAGLLSLLKQIKAAGFTPQLAALAALMVDRQKKSYAVDLARNAASLAQTNAEQAVQAAQTALANADAALAALVQQ